MNESCHTWMSHVTHEWVMSHMNESCHTRMSHVTYEWVMSHKNESCHTRMSHVTQEWVMSLDKTCHACRRTLVQQQRNESCHTHEWVVSHMNESCYTHESCHARECVMSHVWIRACVMPKSSADASGNSHVTHMNKSHHKHEWKKIVSMRYRVAKMRWMP